jgi:hypothetical protein
MLPRARRSSGLRGQPVEHVAPRLVGEGMEQAVQRKRSTITLNILHARADLDPDEEPMSVPTPVVSAPEWRDACEALLVDEKELTRARDALAAERRRLPMVPVDNDYRFERRT